MEEILFRLLEQYPVIIFVTIFLGLPIVLCVVIFFIWKEYKSIAKLAVSERKMHKKELKILAENYAKELKELNEYVRTHDKAYLTAIDNLTDSL